MLPFHELSSMSAAEREKISVACGSSSCRCLCSRATLLEFCREGEDASFQPWVSIACGVNERWRGGGVPYLGDGVDVAVRQQLLLQGAEQLVEVSRLAAVGGGGALLQLIAVLFQLSERLVLDGTNGRGVGGVQKGYAVSTAQETWLTSR